MKEVRKTGPLMVVIEIELSKKIPFFFFSSLMISFLGISMKVSPKNTLSALNLEKKHILCVVT